MARLSRLLLPPWQSFLSIDARASDEDTGSSIDGLGRWDVLGPFQIGTREATWGADPLERYGGFRDISSEDGGSYPSSLTTAGRVTWSRQDLQVVEQNRQAIEVKGSFKFPNVDWNELQSVFGWSARQYQGWARAELTCSSHSAQRVAIFTDDILEFWIDNTHFFGGDFYAYRRAPTIFSLTPGQHRLDIRLTRDIRAMGGNGQPDHPIAIRLEICPDDIRLDSSHILVPEMVIGRGLSSPYGSVPLCNTSTEFVHVQGVQSLNDDVDVSSLNHDSLALAPGQSRPLRFKIETKTRSEFKLHMVLMYTVGDIQQVHLLRMTATIASRNLNEPIRTTFLHPSGVVSYCIIIPPPHEQQFTSEEPSKPLPVLLNLHGAGLEADSHQVRHQMDATERINAWTIFPTGVTAWSGDDWHTWGFRDVEAAVRSIPCWIKSTNWNGPEANLEQWFVTGHSNGGQGTWFAMTHKPDLVMAGAPVSGYSSIQAYVSYNLWNEMKPSIWKCIQTSLANYRHELLLSNTAGMPILEQHGGADDNVPPHHSRRMNQLLQLLRFPVQYHELPGKGHWFDGVMTTEPLRHFYQKIDPTVNREYPNSFRIVIPNSDAFGWCGGVFVDQLSRSSDFGMIDVERQTNPPSWQLKTSNIHRFRFGAERIVPPKILVDGVAFENIDWKDCHFVRGNHGSWQLIENSMWNREAQRTGRQRGAMDAILQTNGSFKLQYSNMSAAPIALQISRNLFQYYGADAKIAGKFETQSADSNSVIVTIGEEVDSLCWSGAISVTSAGITITTRHGDTHQYSAAEGLGIIYSTPLPKEALELRIWGYDVSALRQAARLFPMLTGTGQPDFIVTDLECCWNGAAGVKALGFFDHDWQISEGSHLS